MIKKYSNYQFEEFLNDTDFIQWAQSKRPDLDRIFRDVSESSPAQKVILEKARLFIQSLDDKKIITDQRTKLKSWDRLYKTYKQVKPSRPFVRILPYAAAIILAAFISSLGYYYISNRSNEHNITTYCRQDLNEIKLILNNGQEIIIPEDKSEIDYQAGNDHIIINEKKIILSEKRKHAQINQLIVPYGKSAKIILPDGTIVWLNAGSSISYPETFEPEQRNVSLQGEAFFEVTHLPESPFLVSVSDLTVKVLGTRFNLSAYSDEDEIITVLLDGSVAISENTRRGFFGKEVVLKPMEKANFIKDSKKVNVSQVDDPEFYIAWTEGWLKFKQESVSEILKKLGQYYNINIEFDSQGHTFDLISGSLDIKDSLQNVLLSLSEVADIEYFISENKVIIKKNIN